MPQISDQTVEYLIPPVRKSAQAFGGVCTWQFSQAKNPVRAIIGQSEKTKNGICEILAAKWIVEHARGGSLVQWLSGGSTSRHQINFSLIHIPKLVVLAQTFGLGRDNHFEATQAYLRTSGMLPKQRSFMKRMPRGRKWAAAEDRRDLGEGHGSGECAKAIVDYTGKCFNSYLMIALWGSDAGHAVAAWVGEDVAFFDPNFGEFWFERRKDFQRWFPEFFQSASYSNWLSESHLIEEYALSTAAARQLGSGLQL